MQRNSDAARPQRPMQLANRSTVHPPTPPPLSLPLSLRLSLSLSLAGVGYFLCCRKQFSMYFLNVAHKLLRTVRCVFVSFVSFVHSFVFQHISLHAFVTTATTTASATLFLLLLLLLLLLMFSFASYINTCCCTSASTRSIS